MTAGLAGYIIKNRLMPRPELASAARTACRPYSHNPDDCGGARWETFFLFIDRCLQSVKVKNPKISEMIQHNTDSAADDDAMTIHAPESITFDADDAVHCEVVVPLARTGVTHPGSVWDHAPPN